MAEAIASRPATRGPTAPAGRLRGFQSGAREMDDTPVRIEGKLPDWLRGGLLLNGPALWDLPGGGYAHWFDGHAMLHRVSLGGAGARYRSRMLQTQDLRASTELGSPALGGFGTPDPEGFLARMRHFGKPKMTDNGAVVMSRIGSDWVAQTETPLMTQFDPVTLATIGPVAFTDTEKIHLMSAHGITLPSGVYWNVGIELGPKCLYKVFCIAPGSRRRDVVARIPVGKPGYLHAFAMTPTYAIVWEPALRAQPLSFIFTGRAYKDHFRWEPQGASRIHAVKLSSGAVQTWDVPPMMCFHAVQAFDTADGITLDLCQPESPAIFDALMLEPLRAGRRVDIPHRMLRYALQHGATHATPQTLAEGVELPMVHPAAWTQRSAQFAAAASFDPEGVAPFFDNTAKIDLATGAVLARWRRQPAAVQLEPLFVGRPGAQTDDDGVLLVPTLADEDSGTVVAVLDPATFEALALLRLPQVVPFGFHAAWHPD